MRAKVTTYDNPTVGSGAVVNEVELGYYDLALPAAEYQEHGSAVNTSTSPSVGYTYSGGSNNTNRPLTLVYPDGRELGFSYGSSGSPGDALSRVAALVDDDGSTHLADYSYLGGGLPSPANGRGAGGEGVVVELDYPEPDLRYTLVGTAGGDDPDTGDIYRGLDRFGRVKDSLWYDYGSSADADRIKYGYDRMGSRVWRENTVDSNSNYDEFYLYDNVDRLKQMGRGTLNAQRDAIASLKFAQCWTLDATGNWAGFREDSDGDGDWDLDQARTHNAVNEITDIDESSGPSWITPLYNRAGNMTRVPKPSDPTDYYTCTYDAWNRLVRVTDGEDTVAEYAYDGLKRRVIKKSYTGGEVDQTRHFYYSDRWQVLEERLEVDSELSATPDRQFIWGVRYIDDLLLRDRDSDASSETSTFGKSGSGLDERLYALQDANWNVTAISDETGAIQERFAYTAYGTPGFLTSSFASQSTSAHGFETLYAGYRWDARAGEYHVRYRNLLPHLGIWERRDPVPYTEELNEYRYAANRPVIAIDPMGQFFICGGLAATATLYLPFFGPAAPALGIGITVAVAGYHCIGWTKQLGLYCGPCVVASVTGLLGPIGGFVSVGAGLSVILNFWSGVNKPAQGLGLAIGAAGGVQLAGIPITGEINISMDVQSKDVTITLPDMGPGVGFYTALTISGACTACRVPGEPPIPVKLNMCYTKIKQAVVAVMKFLHGKQVQVGPPQTLTYELGEPCDAGDVPSSAILLGD